MVLTRELVSRLRLRRTNDVNGASLGHSRGGRSSSSNCKKKTATKKRSKDRILQDLNVLIAQHTWTYPGWEEDVQQVRDFHFTYFCVVRPVEERHYMAVIGQAMVERKLQGMHHKQTSHEHGPQHVQLQTLEALYPTLSYPGWKRDYHRALQAHYEVVSNVDFERAVFRVTQRQQAYSLKQRQQQPPSASQPLCPRHARLIALDALAYKSITYPNYQRDLLRLEQHWHVNYGDDHVGNAIWNRHVQTLRNKQWMYYRQLGIKAPDDPNHSLSALELLEMENPPWTYPGWQGDWRTARRTLLDTYGCCVSDAKAVLTTPMALNWLKEHERLHLYGRSHPRMVAMDALVNEYLSEFQRSNPTWQHAIRQLVEWHVRAVASDKNIDSGATISNDDHGIGHAVFQDRLVQLKRRLIHARVAWRLRVAVSTPALPMTPAKEPNVGKGAASPASTASTATMSLPVSPDVSWISDDDPQTPRKTNNTTDVARIRVELASS